VNPLLWLLGGAAGLGLLASSPAKRPPPSSAPLPSGMGSGGKAPVAFTKATIDQAIAVAMTHEKNPANLQAFAGGLLAYGWTSQGSAMLARAGLLLAQQASHLPPSHAPAPSHHVPVVPWSTHYTKAQLESLIAQTEHDISGGGGFGAATGAQRAALETRLAHYKALLAALGHHTSSSHPSSHHHASHGAH
jgi:hypothetical protein